MKQTDIGCISNPKYTYTLKLSNYTPIKEQAIPYPPHVEAWLDEQLDLMLATGRIEPVGPEDDAPMVTALVLAPEA